MEVRIKKIHPSWNLLYPNEFAVGDIVTLDKDNIVTTKNNNRFNANDLTRVFSNTCAYSDIFDKV